MNHITIDNVYLILGEVKYEVESIGFNVWQSWDRYDDKSIEIPHYIYHIDYIYFDDGEVEITDDNKLCLYINYENHNEIYNFKEFIKEFNPKIIFSGKRDYTIKFMYDEKLNP